MGTPPPEVLAPTVAVFVLATLLGALVGMLLRDWLGQLPGGRTVFRLH